MFFFLSSREMLRDAVCPAEGRPDTGGREVPGLRGGDCVSCFRRRVLGIERSERLGFCGAQTVALMPLTVPYRCRSCFFFLLSLRRQARAKHRERASSQATTFGALYFFSCARS